jgi:hypothetical protein
MSYASWIDTSNNVSYDVDGIKNIILTNLKGENNKIFTDNEDMMGDVLEVLNSGGPTFKQRDLLDYIKTDLIMHKKQLAQLNDANSDNVDRASESLDDNDLNNPNKEKEHEWWKNYTQYKRRNATQCHAGVVVKSIENTYYIRQCKRSKSKPSQFCKQHACMSEGDRFEYKQQRNTDKWLVDRRIDENADKEPDDAKKNSIKDIFSSAYAAANRAGERMKQQDYNTFRTLLENRKKRHDDLWKEKMSAHATTLARQFENLSCNAPGNEMVDELFTENDDDCSDDDEKPSAQKRPKTAEKTPKNEQRKRKQKRK